MDSLVRFRDGMLPFFSLWRDKKDFYLTVLAFFYAVFGTFCACLSNSYADRVSTNNKVPISEKYSAPDVLLDTLRPYFYSHRWIPRNIPDIFVVVSGLMALGLCLTRKERTCLVLRRYLVILGTLYLLRSPMIALTVLPAPMLYCVADYDENIWYDTLLLMAQMRVSCGDVFFSGHTIIFASSYHVYRTYSPWPLLTTVVGFTSFFGMFSLILATYHYSIDVLAGFILTTGIWMIYHWAAQVDDLKSTTVGKFVQFWENGGASQSKDHWMTDRRQELPKYHYANRHLQYRTEPGTMLSPQRDPKYHGASYSWTPDTQFRGLEGSAEPVTGSGRRSTNRANGRIMHSRPQLAVE